MNKIIYLRFYTTKKDIFFDAAVTDFQIVFDGLHQFIWLKDLFDNRFDLYLSNFKSIELINFYDAGIFFECYNNFKMAVDNFNLEVKL